MTLDVIRESILHAKREELTTLVVSRKRKLRELYAVAQSAAPIPTLPGLAGDAPPLDHGESAFLDLNDILQGRRFNESTLPARRTYAADLKDSTGRSDGLLPSSKYCPVEPSQQGDKEVAIIGTHTTESRESGKIATKTPTSPPRADVRCRPNRKNEVRDKRRTRPSTVVFAKRNAPGANGVESTSQKPASEQSLDPDSRQDYMRSLFVAQAYSPPRAQPLNHVLAAAHKTLSTSNHYVDLHEQQDSRILRRIYQLQNTNRWSLRQIERSAEPSRPPTHWDLVLDHMKWMRTDFREERKWKLATAKCMAKWCAVWVSSGPEDRAALQVRFGRKHGPAKSGKMEFELDSVDRVEKDDGSRQLQTTAAVEQSQGATQSRDDSLMRDLSEENLIQWDHAPEPAPALFALSAHDVAFSMSRNPSSDNMLHELPLYKATGSLSKDMQANGITSESAWKWPIAPVSKYVNRKIVVADFTRPQRRSRYDYCKDEDDSEPVGNELSPVSQLTHLSLAPEQDNVALFDSENKPIRDRIHAGHAFRPPSEFAMPSQSFFESRHPSQWTVAEDDELRALVKLYSYNWSLISSLISTSSMFASGAERRTPWECFERWISLEGLPTDMQKTPYFRTYHTRIDAPQRLPASQPQSAQPQQEAGAASTPVKRRSTQPFRVERRKQSKHLTLIDAMRRLAKKRESSMPKQQNAAGTTVIKKANVEATQPRAPVYTPQDLSKLKFERDQKMRERAEAYHQHVLAQQRAVLQQKTAQHSVQHSAQQPLLPGGTVQHQRGGSLGSAGAPSPHLPSLANGSSQGPLPSQSRQHPSLSLPQGNVPGYANSPILHGGNVKPQMGLKGVPQAHMHSNIPIPQRHPQQANDMRLLAENNRIQQEQRRFLQQQQQQQGQNLYPNHQNQNHVGPSSSPAMASNSNGVGGQPSLQSNPIVMGAAQAGPTVNGITSPHHNTLNATTGPSPSVHATHNPLLQTSPPQSLSSGMVPAINSIQHQIKVRNPGASPEQIKKLTSEQLAAQYQQRMSQSAMSAAAGGNSGQHVGIPNSTGGTPSQQLYAQMIRAQQASQSKAVGGLPNGMRPSNGAGQPQRGPTPHTTPGQNQSPRPPQAQMAGAQ